jgi:hypothetical protein
LSTKVHQAYAHAQHNTTLSQSQHWIKTQHQYHLHQSALLISWASGEIITTTPHPAAKV